MSRVPLDEREVGEHRVDGRVGMEDDHRVLRRDVELLAEADRALRIGRRLPPPDRVEPALTPRLDAEKQANEPQPLELYEGLAIEVLRATLEHQPDVAEPSALHRPLVLPNPLEVLLRRGHEEVVVVEHELPHSTPVIQLRELGDDVLWAALPKPRPGREAMQGGDAAVVAVAYAAATAHQVRRRHSRDQPRGAHSIGSRQRVERFVRASQR